MAYIPPHKRHSKDEDGPSPTPELLIPQFHKNLNLSRSGSGSNVERRKDKRSMQGVNANDAIYRLFAVDLADDGSFPSSTCLDSISWKSFEKKFGEPPLTLVLDSPLTKENKEIKEDVLKSPWESVAEDVQEDLLSSFRNLRKVMECQELEEVKPTLVARIGEIIFHDIVGSSVAETTLRLSKRSFNPNVPLSYMKYVTTEAVPKSRLDFEDEKELYRVKLSDSMSPDSTIFCKCRAMKDCKKLELYKIELYPVRHLVVDISSFLNSELDLRLMLNRKRILTNLTEKQLQQKANMESKTFISVSCIVGCLKDDEKCSIKSLINSAVLDPDVKGGLRWPLGKDTSGERYTVVGIWHTNAKTFRSSAMRLKVQHADRFDFRTSVGKVTGEVNLKMTGILSQLQEQNVQIDLVVEMLKDNLKLIWDCFLCCDGPST